MKDKTGLAISGGGYRATLFALGSLWRFNLDGLLTTLDTITSLSGGSITSAYLAYKWKDLTFECLDEEKKKYRATNFEAAVVTPLLAFCKNKIDMSSILKGMLNPFSSPAQEVAKQYDRYLFNQAKLSDIPPNGLAPEFVYYATNYDTGASVRITRDYLSDYHLGKAKGHNLSIARTISISSAFPPFMAPVTLAGESWQWDSPPTFEKDIELRKKLHLCDGGLYDNLALEMIWKTGSKRKYGTVFSCDAGAPFEKTVPPSSFIKNLFAKITSRKGNWLGQLSRMIDVMINQQTSLRKRVLVANYVRKEYAGAYWAIQTRTSSYPDIPHPIAAEDEKAYAHLRSLPTQLGPFEGQDNLKLVNWGFAQADIALRGRCDEKLPCYPVPFKV